MLNENNSDKKLELKTLISFFVAILLMILLLIAFSFIAKKSWNNKLKIQIEKVLEQKYPEKFPNSYQIGESVSINSTIAVSSNMYKIMSNGNFSNQYIVITRVTTYYGPQAAVFTINKYGEVSFEGFACLNSRIKNQLSNSETDITLKFWKKQVEKIYQETINLGGQDE